MVECGRQESVNSPATLTTTIHLGDEQRMAKRKSTKVPRICQYCGISFLIFRCFAAPGRIKCCSTVCSYKLRKRSLVDRFWEKVNKTETCWLWTASTQGGYGQIGHDIYLRPVRAHRVSWELHYGPIPAGLDVLHKCDNPPCVRPDHLFIGTALDNVQDMLRKERQPQALYLTYEGTRMRLSEFAQLINVPSGTVKWWFRTLHLSPEEMKTRSLKTRNRYRA